MRSAKPSFDDEFQRLEDLVAEVGDALGARDYRRLTDLGNRLATQAVITNALSEKPSEAA